MFVSQSVRRALGATGWAVLLALVLGLGLPGSVRIAAANDGAPCPPAMRFEGGPGAEFDAGFTGFYHGREVVGYLLNVAIDTGTCDGTVQPTCGVCSLQQLLPNAGGSNQRCVGDTSTICSADSDCSGTGPCRFFATPPLSISGGGIGVCLTNEITGSIAGTVNVEEGRVAIDVPQNTAIHIGPAIDMPCPVCAGDTTPNDGVRDGTCTFGPRSGLACDTNAVTVSFGATSFDCPPAVTDFIGDLALDARPIRVTTETAEATRTLTASSPGCTAAGYGGSVCMCSTCATLAEEPCSDDSDCPAAITCGGLRCLGGAAAGTPCTTPGIGDPACLGGQCNIPGEPTKPNTCSDVTCVGGVCPSGPYNGYCGPTETFRGCVLSSDCPFPGDTCSFLAQLCFDDNGMVGGSVAVPVSADPLASTSNTIAPSTGALFCVPPTDSAASNSAAGLPGLTRLSFPGSMIVFAEEIVEGAAAAGETVTSDTEGDGATSTDSIETAVTTSAGQRGVTDVEIVETYNTGTAPAGFGFLGRLVQLTVPDGSVTEPLTIEFFIDASEVSGREILGLEIRKNGVLVPDCTGAPQAIPDPCVSERELLPGGDARIEVLSSTGSIWDALAPPPGPAPLAYDQQRCVNGLNKSLLKIDKTATKQLTACLKNYGKGAPLNSGDPAIDTLEECVVDDPKGKILKAENKAAAAFAKNCTSAPTGKLVSGFPTFGATDAGTVGTAAAEKGRNLIHGMFGADLDAGVLVTESTNKDEAKCQQAVWKSALKCQQTKLKEFVKCKRDGLRGKVPPGLMSSADDLRDLCLGTGANGQPDLKGKIAKKCTDPAAGIHKDMVKQCVAKQLDPSELFPPCADPDPLVVSLCIEAAVECAVCRAANQADDLTRDCDLFDNGSADGSCASDPGDGDCASPFVFPSGGGTLSNTTFFDAPIVHNDNGLGDCTSSSTGPEFVYAWTPTTSGTATIQTCSQSGGTLFDTTLYVRSNCNDETSELACNDNTDSCWPNSGTCGYFIGSQLSLSVVAGQTYYVFIDGHDLSSDPLCALDRGPYELTIIPPT